MKKDYTDLCKIEPWVPEENGEGHIELIISEMHSGKTTELQRRLVRYELAQRKVMAIKYAGDTRYSITDMATHDKRFYKAHSTNLLAKVLDIAMRYDVIGIDEGNFLADCLPFAEHLANRGKIVIIAALNGTFMRTPFPPAPYKTMEDVNIAEFDKTVQDNDGNLPFFGDINGLVSKAEYVVKLHSVCMHCYGEGSFTARISDSNNIQDIGGQDKYTSTCRKCHWRLSKEKTQSKK